MVFLSKPFINLSFHFLPFVLFPVSKPSSSLLFFPFLLMGNVMQISRQILISNVSMQEEMMKNSNRMDLSKLIFSVWGVCTKEVRRLLQVNPYWIWHTSRKWYNGGNFIELTIYKHKIFELLEIISDICTRDDVLNIVHLGY